MQILVLKSSVLLHWYIAMNSCWGTEQKLWLQGTALFQGELSWPGSAAEGGRNPKMTCEDD